MAVGFSNSRLIVRSITHGVYSNSFNWIALLKILICGRLLSSRKKCFKCNVAKNLLAAGRGGGGDGGRTYGFWRLLHQRIRQIEKKKLSRALVPWKNSHSDAAEAACIDCGMQIHVRLSAP
jgi:hypothetical protein